MSNKHSAQLIKAETKSVMEVIVDFASRNIIKTIFLIGIALVLLRVTQILILIFIGFILMAATKPAAVFLNRRLRMPEGLAISLVYIGVLIFVGALVYIISRPLGEEFGKFASNVPQLSTNLVDWLLHIPFVSQVADVNQLRDFFNQLFGNIVDQFSTIANSVVDLTVNAFRGIVTALFLIIFSIYLFLEREDIKAFIVRFFDLNPSKFGHIYDRIEIQLGAWVRGQLTLALAVGLATYIGLILLDVKYAIPLAILAGILEIVPIVGPLVTGAIVTLVGLSISPITGVFCLLLSIAVQQLENNFLVPVIMKRAVGLSPVVTIISLLIGQELFGILGAIISVPFSAMISVLISAYMEERSHNHRQVQEVKE